VSVPRLTISTNLPSAVAAMPMGGENPPVALPTTQIPRAIPPAAAVEQPTWTFLALGRFLE